ncbi:hypothetical protein [Sinomicrobium weinanense]|uniref:Lipoprotein n=1 Tax=Sinomicrobium weinanense TaxID=2842200 RepID=A0A926JWL2_9FLAO|nr:hypothetical protein [Sinomicrobium weinanense]MBC9798501.1 hypothetical protein [Sinomicrobium weinanense]MBU3126014.1 hypothetical protein [Sinomicrobium weinanense]
MKKSVFIIILFSFLTGCYNHGVEFELKNESGNVIDSVEISNGFTKIKMYDINKDITSSFLDFNGNDKKVSGDGSYTITIFSKGKYKTEGFGYYSNGVPSIDYYKVLIKKDTILVKEIID